LFLKSYHEIKLSVTGAYHFLYCAIYQRAIATSLKCWCEQYCS